MWNRRVFSVDLSTAKRTRMQFSVLPQDNGRGGRIRTSDLWVMSPASDQAALRRNRVNRARLAITSPATRGVASGKEYRQCLMHSCWLLRLDWILIPVASCNSRCRPQGSNLQLPTKRSEALPIKLDQHVKLRSPKWESSIMNGAERKRD